MAVKDDKAFVQALAFMANPSAQGASQMKGILKKYGKPVNKPAGQATTGKVSLYKRRKQTMSALSLANNNGGRYGV